MRAPRGKGLAAAVWAALRPRADRRAASPGRAAAAPPPLDPRAPGSPGAPRAEVPPATPPEPAAARCAAAAAAGRRAAAAAPVEGRAPRPAGPVGGGSSRTGRRRPGRRRRDGGSLPRPRAGAPATSSRSVPRREGGRQEHLRPSDSTSASRAAQLELRLLSWHRWRLLLASVASYPSKRAPRLGRRSDRGHWRVRRVQQRRVRDGPGAHQLPCSAPLPRLPPRRRAGHGANRGGCWAGSELFFAAQNGGPSLSARRAVRLTGAGCARKRCARKPWFSSTARSLASARNQS